jgi:hypothetical protein
MAKALTGAAIDAVISLVGSVAFSRLRRLLRSVRGRLLPRRFKASADQPLTLGRAGLAGAAVGVVRAGEAAGAAKKELEREADWLGVALTWGAVTAGSVLLVVGAVSVAGGGKDKAR